MTQRQIRRKLWKSNLFQRAEERERDAPVSHKLSQSLGRKHPTRKLDQRHPGQEVWHPTAPQPPILAPHVSLNHFFAGDPALGTRPRPPPNPSTTVAQHYNEVEVWAGLPSGNCLYIFPVSYYYTECIHKLVYSIARTVKTLEARLRGS